ncbi:MgtC/SapB family protein [Acinetobacter rudis]|uniref:MgtC/SapB family protein n=1 Tax=Acinetobacter rudis TaxID=632955 RepID=UPI0028107043|nr:MgtC/SapB family protein [Acinetobacter rudis]MDQ8952542.1 MgtC/SapB family protein [Acinetobacter rudis]
MNILLQTLSFQELLTIMLSALGCGLLIGLERERNKNNNPEQSFAGLRSFTITALLGALSFLLHLYIGVIGAITMCLFGLYGLSQQKKDIGSTTELAFFMTYIIGAVCVWNIPLAASMAVLLTIILMGKKSLHHFAGETIQSYELRDGLFLLALILIALPIMPNTPLWGAVLNPYVILKLLILILLVQSMAHVAKRLLSNDKAVLLSALASGFVSSTATIASLGVQVRSEQANVKLNAGAALISCVATLLQLLLIVLGVSIEWFKLLLIPCLAGIIILCLAAGLLIFRSPQPKQQLVTQAKDSRMFSIKEAVIIAVSLTVIQAGIYGATLLLGDKGLILGTFLASLFEVHAAMAGVVMQGDTHNQTLIYAMIIGLSAHSLSKSINAFITGGWKFFIYFAPSQILHILVMIFLLFLGV